MPIKAPLIYIPAHVAEPQSIGGLCSHIMGARSAVIGIPCHGPGRCGVVVIGCRAAGIVAGIVLIRVFDIPVTVAVISISRGKLLFVTCG